eukprot:1420413-Rhodomonas_salina.2
MYLQNRRLRFASDCWEGRLPRKVLWVTAADNDVFVLGHVDPERLVVGVHSALVAPYACVSTGAGIEVREGRIRVSTKIRVGHAARAEVPRYA